MTDAKQPAQFDWATELSDAEAHVSLSEQEAHEIGARLRSMGAKLKTYEDLGGAADDVQLLRIGYAAARLEIESLQVRIKTMAEEHADELTVAHLDGIMLDFANAGEIAFFDYAVAQHCRATLDILDGKDNGAGACNEPWASVRKRLLSIVELHQSSSATQGGFVPAGAQQPGTAGLVGALEDAQRAINSMKVEAETAAQGDEQMMLEACETISNEGLQADMAIRAALASHGQAPAQAAAPAHAGEYPALVCDYCGALTPDPWHSSGMLHGKMSKHIHSCDACWRGAAQPAPVRGTPADLPPLPDPDLRDVGTNPEDIKNFLRGYATEYAKVALAARAPADIVQEDAAQVEIDLFNDLNRIYGNTLTAYAKELCRLGYRKTNAARKQGETND